MEHDRAAYYTYTTHSCSTYLFDSASFVTGSVNAGQGVSCAYFWPREVALLWSYEVSKGLRMCLQKS